MAKAPKVEVVVDTPVEPVVDTPVEPVVVLQEVPKAGTSYTMTDGTTVINY